MHHRCNRTLGFLLAALLVFTAGLLSGAETKTIALEELDVKLSSCGWNTTQRCKSAAGNPLRLRGKTYARGIGTHTPGMFRIDVDKRAVRFQATVGVDDEVANAGTVEFRVIGDGKLLWSSAVLKGGGEIKTCDVNLTGVKILDLVVDTTPDGFGCDHSDWVDTKIEYTGAPPVAKKTANSFNHRWPPADQVFHKASLPDPSDRDEAETVLRRVGVLVEHLKKTNECLNLAAEEKCLADLKAQAQKTDLSAVDARTKLLEDACRLRRKVAFANPLLDFDKILFIKRHFCPDAETTGNHMCDQCFGFNAIRGGGLFVLENAFSDKPAVRNVLENSVCENKRLQGKKLTSDGGFLAPDLSCDAKQVLFAWTEVAEKEQDRKRYQQWNEHNTYKIFRVNVDGTGLTELTDGPWNDFDPCFLPNGRIVFISERRGGYGRCHGRPVPSFTLHSMNADGSDIVCLSPHETNEWQPSVDNNGMIVYTRWDYVDRGFNQAHHAWTTFPDGRDPRVIHGNFSPNQGSRPHYETTLRAVPGSRKYMATAACHHGQAYGSILLIDPTIPDDEAMGPVKRLTPDQLFPEAEIGTHGDPANYAGPYPLSEYFFLCVHDPDSRSNAGTNNNYGIYLLDAFGNKELLYRDPQISCLDPIPLKPRPRPPVIPSQTTQASSPDDKSVIPDVGRSGVGGGAGVVSIINVYDSLYPMPKDTKITHLRVMQLLPKTTPYANNPRIGYGDQKSARMVLGTVPVEADGSAYFKMPANRPVFFQALAADGLAVQSMRSATYLHPGEKLTCRGCHEPKNLTFTTVRQAPKAFLRAPSEIVPDVAGSRPFSYPILVQPVLEKNCVACHEKSRAEGKKSPDLSKGDKRKPGQWFISYDSLRTYTFFWDNAVFDGVPVTTPGKFGARASKLYQMLVKGHHDVKLSPEDFHRITLWMDCNSDFFGAYDDLQGQLEGKLVWPKIE
ncbi:MAG: NPCBM/NEW2 domain-containing protein [Planctomycetota bacterium]|nr:NPCBM/NEW2 domain-containing protein [Planctomycetota bacterium]